MTRQIQTSETASRSNPSVCGELLTLLIFVKMKMNQNPQTHFPIYGSHSKDIAPLIIFTKMFGVVVLSTIFLANT